MSQQRGTGETHSDGPNGQRVFRVEILISNLLRAGILISSVVVVTGMVLTFARHPEYVHSTSEFQRLMHPGVAEPLSLRRFWTGLCEMRGPSIVMLGIALLIATPMMRVAVSILIFIHERDRIYVAITSAVLLLLGLALLLGASA